MAVTGCELCFNGFNGRHFPRMQIVLSRRKGPAFEIRNLLPSKSQGYNEPRSVAEAAATYGRVKLSSQPAVKILPMIGCRFAKLLAGAVLIHAAEQAYAHAYLIQFPHQGTASQNLIPASGILLALGLVLAVWGLVPERKPG